MTTTTSHLQVKKDFYSSREECNKADRQTINTNPRYSHFNQTHFTAGDEDQFEEYRDATNGRLIIPEIPDENVFSSLPSQTFWEKYRNIDPISVENTFNYLFYKFKKGIFIKIKERQLRVFLPFSNKNFINEWSDKIKVDPKYGSLQEFFKHIQVMSGYKYNPKSINSYPENWYANNCLVRYEYPIHEGDTNHTVLQDMFLTLCKEREVPDMEFFLNRRDFPLLKTDGTEPYSHLYDTANQKLLSHDYDKYCPILSMTTAKNYADVPVPTCDDWIRIGKEEGKYFSHTRDDEKVSTVVPSWEERKSTAVFRGSSTGCGVTVKTNMRLKLAHLSKVTPPDSDGVPLLDAGITEWNLRPRKLKKEKYLQTINIKNLPFGLVPSLSPQTQADYKYLINVDGHVTAFRLGRELGSGSCVLLVKSKYKIWYHEFLKPYVHFVPVKTDLSDLLDKVRWCKEHDEKCKKIADNALVFYKKYLCKDGILDYLQKILCDLKKVNRVYMYNVTSVLNLQLENERKILEEEKLFLDTTVTGPTQEIFRNKNTVITLCGKNVVRKSNGKNLVHEAFVSLETNKLRKFIPNFVMGYGLDLENRLLTEHVEGQTFNDYIKGDTFSMIDYKNILVQLALALYTAQKKCDFIHYDLAPWNVVLKLLPKPIEIDYEAYRIRTKIIPVIIDMGRAHIIRKNRHFGVVNPFQGKNSHDILTILVKSIFEITNFDLSDQDTTDIITIANFLSGTEYRRRPFQRSGYKGLGDVRFFFQRAKKYTELLKSSSLQLSPLDFVEYMMRKFPQIPIEGKKDEYKNLIVHLSDAKKLPVTSSDINPNSVALAYARAFHKVTKEKLDCEQRLTITRTLEALGDQMINFLDTTEIDPKKYVKKYEKTINLFKIENQGKTSFTEKFFLQPRSILNLLLVGDSGQDQLKEISREIYSRDLEYVKRQSGVSQNPELISQYEEILSLCGIN